MAKYRVTVVVLSKPKFDIEATSPQEAEQIAYETLKVRQIEEEALAQGLVEIMGYEADTEPLKEPTATC